MLRVQADSKPLAWGYLKEMKLTVGPVVGAGAMTILLNQLTGPKLGCTGFPPVDQ
jgi:hypothetical protein